MSSDRSSWLASLMFVPDRVLTGSPRGGNRRDNVVPPPPPPPPHILNAEFSRLANPFVVVGDELEPPSLIFLKSAHIFVGERPPPPPGDEGHDADGRCGRHGRAAEGPRCSFSGDFSRLCKDDET
ncbi:transcription factor FapR [Striga asiatica]|uniref:Transcription factor FapR n=1 Tax=Striga asiatica TaxID=4170 RepID=A0A5A7PTL1_STRAF|nr:transcription factor FapR [Striga asiatica]